MVEASCKGLELALLHLGTSHAATWSVAGIVWALLSFVAAGICQTTWLWLRSRDAAADVEAS